MPFFKLREKIRLQDVPNHFITLGPGIVEVDEATAKHGFLCMVGERVPELEDGEEASIPVVSPPLETPTTIDLNPGPAPAAPVVMPPSVKLPPAPLKPFGEGPKSLQQKAEEAASKPTVDDTNMLAKTIPVKPVPPESTEIKTIKTADEPADAS